jgi:hypothetical protein
MDLAFPVTTSVTAAAAAAAKNPSSRLRHLKYSIGQRIAQERLVTSTLSFSSSSSSSSCSFSEQQQGQSKKQRQRPYPLQPHNHHHQDQDPNTTIHNNNTHVGKTSSTSTSSSRKKSSTQRALVYRRPRGNLFHSASQGYYYSCTFLDNTNVVLCVDHCGIDAIRLSSTSSGSSNNNNNDSRENPLWLGRAIATGIHATSTLSSSSSSSLPHVPPPLIQTTSIFGGTAFCTGLASGEFRIFGTEHASTWANNAPPIHNTRNAHFPNNDLQPLNVSQRIPSKNNNDPNNNTNNNTTFITHAWSVPGPQRRFQPDARATLSRQLRNASCIHARHMEEIAGWNADNNNNNNPYSNGHQYHHQHSKYGGGGHGNGGGLAQSSVCHWDFRETNTSTLLALHVGKYQDNVGLRVLDSRGTSCSSNSRSSSRNQVGIFVDMPDSNSMSVSACCFVTDTIIATAQRGASTPERIRLWDLRQMIQPRGSSSSKTNAQQQQQQLLCPSFPREVVHALNPFQEPIHLLSQQQQQEAAEEQCMSSLLYYNGSGGREGGGKNNNDSNNNNMRIVDLKSNNHGGLLVTTAEDGMKRSNDMVRSTTQRHWAVDLSRIGGGGEATVPVTLPYQVDSNNDNDCFLACSSPFATDARCSVVATYTQTPSSSSLHHHHHHYPEDNFPSSRNDESGGQNTISLYDILSNADRIRHANAMMQNEPQQRRNKTTTKKRNRQNHHQQEPSQRHDFLLPTPTGHIDAIIQDEYGLVTGGKIVSIAMNASGTALVGVSRDSDLYCWTTT